MGTSVLAEAQELLSRGKASEAAAAFERAAAEGGGAQALLGLARSQLAQRQLPKARAALEQLLALEPGSAEGQSHLAFIDALEGDRDAVETLRRLGGAAQAGFYERFNLGLYLATAGELDGARLALSRAVEKEPKSVHALSELGQIALRQGDTGAAVDAFSRAAAVDAARSLPLALLARAHLARGEKGKAIRALADALRRAPAEKPLYELLARVCMEAGAPKQAAQAAAELRRLDPHSPTAPLLLGEALLASGKAQEALHAFQSAAEASELPEARVGLARCHRALSDDEQARLVLENVLSGSPDHRDAAAELARIHLSRREPERARDVLERALAAHGEDPVVNLLMARALAASQPSLAVAHARKAIARGAPDTRDEAEALLRSLR